MLGGVIDPDNHREIGLPLNNGGRKDYVWSARDHIGFLLVLTCPVIKLKVKPQQHNPSRIAKDTDPSGMKVWVTPPGKEPRLLREEEIEWAAEEGSNKYHLRPRDQLQK